MIVNADLDLEVDVHFAMALQEDCGFPCCDTVDSKSCRSKWNNGVCPGGAHSTPQCVTDPKNLTELHKVLGQRCLSIECENILKPYRESGSNEAPRLLLYRFMKEKSKESGSRRAASA